MRWLALQCIELGFGLCWVGAMDAKPGMRNFSLRLDPALRAALDTAARAERRTAGSLARVVLADWLMDWLADRERSAKAVRRDVAREQAA